MSAIFHPSKIILVVPLATALGLFFSIFRVAPAHTQQAADVKEPLRIGWIGPMSGPTAKYGAYQAAMLAEADINAAGGIRGRPLKLIFQDGKASGRESVTAANYLINVEHVHYIVGGHCTPESLPISSVAERNKVLMMAAITSSPKLTPAGDYVFRVTAVNTQGVDKLLPYIQQHSLGKRFGVIYEETDYAEGLGEYFRQKAPSFGFEVATFDGYAPGEQDFRGILTRIKQARLDGLYISVQAPDAAVLIAQRMRELGINALILGNELTGNAAQLGAQTGTLFEGLIFAEPRFDRESPAVKALRLKFKEHFGAADLPYGIWTAEAYDAVRVMADAIGRCGDDVEKVKNCLYQTRSYPGVSGPIGFDENGDGTKSYVLKTVRQGQIVELN
jgi:branched-chain amino acid transport system substrate-binding protein